MGMAGGTATAGTAIIQMFCVCVCNLNNNNDIS